MSNECFEMAYGWMISDQIYCPRSQLLDLLVATEVLKCASLARSLFQRLDDHRHFSDLKAFACFWEAKRRGIKAMADMMLARAGKAFLALVCTKGYMRLDVCSLCDLLRSDSLAVQSEIEVRFFTQVLHFLTNSLLTKFDLAYRFFMQLYYGLSSTIKDVKYTSLVSCAW